MKKILTVLVSAVAATAVYGQGYFNFANVPTGSGNIKIGTPAASGEGIVGQYVGSSYSASAYYSLTPISVATDPATLTLITGSGSLAAFYGVGASEADQGNGAGFFQGGNATINGTGDGQTVYVEVAVWWGAAGSYSAAVAGGNNAGYSAPVAIRLASGGDQLVGDLTGISAFTVQQVPEPATIALGGLGAAALLLFRRRK